VQCSLRSGYSLHDARTATRRATSYGSGVYSHRLNNWSQIAQCIKLVTSGIADIENWYWTVQYRGVNIGDIQVGIPVFGIPVLEALLMVLSGLFLPPPRR